MKVYRAMCQAEFDSTVKYGKAHFNKRFKWFSPSLEWVKQRVQDGKFNNSNCSSDRYIHIVEFEADVSKADWNRNNEIQFDNRRNPQIVVTNVIVS